MSDSSLDKIFGQLPYPVLLADEKGCVRFLNSAAATAIGTDRGSVLGSPCWKVACFETGEGAPFCSRFCPIHEFARERGPQSSEWLVRHPAQKGAGETRMLTVLVRRPRLGRYACLHLLVPRRKASKRSRPDRPLSLFNGDTGASGAAQLVSPGGVGNSVARTRDQVTRTLMRFGLYARVVAFLAWIENGG
ncbi:MAG: hypothetical protein ACE5E4_09545 [Candidatus Binatia bacterium]